MFLEQIVQRQEKLVETTKNTPIHEVWNEIRGIKEKLKDQDRQLEDVQSCPNQLYLNNSTEEIKEIVCKLQQSFECLIDKLNESDQMNQEQILNIIDLAMEEDVPVMPLKNSPETGIKTLGLPIPVELRDRLLVQKNEYALKSYKAAVFVALRVGLEILEKIEYT